MLKLLIAVFEKSGIYKNFIKNMPYPFNDIYFVTAVVLITTCLIAVYIVQSIRNSIIKQRIRKKQEEARLRRLSEEKNEKSERSELMELMRKNAEDKKRGAEDDKEYLTTHDKETGLLNKFSYNKALFGLSIDDLLVIYIDINNLKKTNDVYGRTYGDRLLNSVAKELKENFTEKCYRIGGDEFVVLISGMSEKIAKRKIEKIRYDLNALSESDAEGIIYSAAFGIAVSDGIKTKQELIDLAEERMKEDKRNAKGELKEKYGEDDYVDVRGQANPDDEIEANKDAMTGLMTKEAFEETLKAINETNLSVISADIDGLKLINDKFSHHAGDMVIRGFSAIINKYFEGCCYRISDDDFCIITNRETKESLYKKIDLVKLEMIKKTEQSEKGIFFSASFGISTNADDGDKLIDCMLDECLIMMRKDKEDYRSGRRSLVVVSDPTLLEEDVKEIKPLDSEYDIDGILEEKRREGVIEEEVSEKNALTSLLHSMASKEEESYMEAENEEKIKQETKEREERLNEEIKAKYNKEDLTSHKKSTSRQRKVTEEVLKSEVEKMKREEKKKKKGLFKKNKPDSDDGDGDAYVSGNTVDDIDIL